MGRARWRTRLARWLAPELTETGITIEAHVSPAPWEASASRGDPLQAVAGQYALRILSLAEQLRGHLDRMEADEQDPDRLRDLYALDHGITRVRRHAANLRVMAGHPEGEELSGMAASLLDIIRVAESAIEHYQRITIGTVAQLAVVEYAADDLSRLLAELLDNATQYSPPGTTALVSAHLTNEGSVLFRIEDSGIGLAPERLEAFNALLAEGTPRDATTAPTQLGLLVVSRLARTHGIRVWLTRRAHQGTTANVLVPDSLLCEIPQAPVARAELTAGPSSSGQPKLTGTEADTTAEMPIVAIDGPPSHPVPRPREIGGDRGVRPPAQRQPHLAPVEGGGGGRLPRRVPTSLRGNPTAPAKALAASTSSRQASGGRPGWHEELAAFVTGDQAARHGAARPDATVGAGAAGQGIADIQHITSQTPNAGRDAVVLRHDATAGVQDATPGPEQRAGGQ